MGDLLLWTPALAEDVTTAMWTPSEVTYIQSWLVEPEPGWKLPETGLRVFKHEFMLKFMGETEMFGVIATDDTSEAHIEDMAAGTSEKSMEKIRDRVRARGSKVLPEHLAREENKKLRHDLAGAWRDMKRHAAKRRKSTNGKIYYPGLVL